MGALMAQTCEASAEDGTLITWCCSLDDGHPYAHEAWAAVSKDFGDNLCHVWLDEPVSLAKRRIVSRRPRLGEKGPNVIYHDPILPHLVGSFVENGPWVVEIDNADWTKRCDTLLQAHDVMREMVGVLDFIIEDGQCDWCDFVYETANSEDHCGECGSCRDHCLCDVGDDDEDTKDKWMVAFEEARSALVVAGWSQRTAAVAAFAAADAVVK